MLAAPAWRRAALGVLLAATAALYTVGLSASGWGNAYYAAAAQAGSRSWSAMFFGGLDPAGGVTVDKPPAALWLMDVSVRLFGLSSWSVLLPQAACGVAAVALLYATVRRQALGLTLPASPGRRRAAVGVPLQEARAAATGLLAAAALAVTPVATLMARYDNPDELMLLLLVAAAYALTRSVGAVEGGGWWLALAGALLGFAFLTKMLQAWLVLPAFLAVALVAGAGSLGRRLARCAGAGAVLLASAGWWLLVVQLTPAARRPWVGGSRGNSVLELALGYNGVGRLTGQEADGGATNVAFSGGVLRLLSTWAPDYGWLLPAALVGLGAGWALIRGRGRRDPLRAALLLWGGWLVVVVVVLGSMHGIAHGYYTVQLAPAVTAAAVLGGALLWLRGWESPRSSRPRRVLALGVAANALWTAVVLVRHASSPFVLLAGVPVLAAGAAGTVLLTERVDLRRPVTVRGRRRLRTVRAIVLAAVALGLLLAPAVWSVATAETAHRGPNLASGPGRRDFPDEPGVSPGSAPVDGVSTALATAVRGGSAGYRWAAAVVGHRAGDLQLASGVPVWALGGYSGNDPHPTVAQFLVAAGRRQVHYLVVTPGDLRASGQAGRIVRWALDCLPAQRSGRWLRVDLTVPAGRSGACALG